MDPDFETSGFAESDEEDSGRGRVVQICPICSRQFKYSSAYRKHIKSVSRFNILSRASEAGSPTNRSGNDKTRGQGSFGPSTGGPDLHMSLQPAELTNTR